MFYKPIMMDALSDYESSTYVIFGVPFDATSSYRSGSRWAPDAMRKASLNFESYNHFYKIDLQDLAIHDSGNFEISASIDETLHDLLVTVRSVVSDNKIPIMLGGEHSMSLPCIKACAENAGNDFGVLVLDAHLDLRDEYAGVKYNHACVSRHILEEVTENYVTVGVRSGAGEEWDLARDRNICHYTPEDVARKGIDGVADEIMDYLDCSRIYISLDMDVFDPAYAPGLGTPEPFGMNPWDVRKLIHRFAPMSIGFDIVEIAPEYDSGQAAILGAKIMREFIAASASKNKKIQ
ncbi:agmatinase [Methanosalsum zhilinae DSM 4017]|uniref:Agmatinase n=1 Tax=Methanosalsum zhilinae (strain DSM 4017 / NBRC 107636 / OCM 62 / WeN5) TaxID=679901 RepID=F7XKF9_METZD|nr:agmatinase [Methanosalsum zhilinae]AEH61730.1 agmatinase [Methanosalsum zhilinae DSM 4017]